MNNAPPSPKQPKFFDGKKEVVPMSPIVPITNNEISVLKNHFNGDLNIHKLSFKIGEKVKVNSSIRYFYQQHKC